MRVVELRWPPMFGPVLPEGRFRQVTKTAAEPAVRCAHSKMVDPRELRPNPRNPNFHPAHQVSLLGRIIASGGWRAPITVSRRSGLVVRGHGRLAAALEIGCALVPVDFQDYDSEALEHADLLADNKIAELSEVDWSALAGIVRDLPAESMPLTGLSEREVSDLLTKEWRPPEVGDMPAMDATEFVEATTGQAATIRSAMSAARSGGLLGADSTDGAALAAICSAYIGGRK